MPGADPDPNPPAAWSRWWVPAVLAAAALPLILAFGPEYGNLQSAEDAGEVRDILGEDRWRYAIAALVDFAFAASYGFAAFALSKRAGLHRWAPLGLVGGAVLDQAENVFVLANVIWASSIGDTPVDIMRTLGALKMLALLAGAVVFLVSVGLRHVWPRRHEPDAIPSEARQNARLAVAFTAFIVALAAFAGAVRIAAPVPAIVALGLVCAYALGRLSAADRRAGGRAWPFLLVMVVAGEWVVVSVHGDVPDGWGFAALGAVLYAIVRSIDHARRKFTGVKLRVRLSVVAVAGCLLALVPVDGVRIAGAVTAIVFGAAGVELWSASYPKLLSFNRMATGFVGVVLLAGVTWSLQRMNDDPVITSIVVAGVLVATALLITSNDAWILVGVLLLATLWSGVPRSASKPEGQDVVRDQPYFAVLGDSYISGEGTDRYFEGTNTEGGNQCRRSPSAWPVILNPPQTHDTGDLLGVPARVLNEACSGAVTADIRQLVNDGRDEPEQLVALSAAVREFGPPRFVVVSIGGNDAQFADIGAACVLPGDCTEFLDEVRKDRLPAVGDEVARTHAEIRKVVGPAVPVIAVPYPEPLRVDTPCAGVVLSAGDITAVNGFLAALNVEVRDAAATAGSQYMDTMALALADSAAQLCEPHGGAGLNFADFNPKAGSLWAALNPKNWTHNFIHPNEGGHAALRAAALRWFADHPCVLAASCPPGPLSALELDQLAALPAGLAAEVENEALPAIAEVVPVAVAALAFLTLGWWLLITAVRPPMETTTEVFEGPAEATNERPRSVLERLSAPRDG